MTERQGPASAFVIESTGNPAPFYVFLPVTSFVAAPGSAVGDVDLSWSNPAHPEFQKVIIRRKTGGYPTDPSDGALVYDGNQESTTDSGLPTGITYFYSAWAYDVWNIPSSAALTSSEPLPPDTTAPGPVTSFTATPGPANIQLDWVNPTDPDFAGVVIRRRDDMYPTSETDGVLVYDGSGTEVLDSGLDHTKTYYYAAFAYDAPIQGPPPNYSTPAQVSESPNQAYPTEVRVLEKGLIEALTEAIGEQDTEIGGHRLTRLTAVANEGDTSIAVEATEGWPETGAIGIDGVKYSYAGKTFTSFTGLKHIAAGAEVTGCATQHRNDSPVVDTTKAWSAIEQLRRALLVEYADGDNLNVIGRNLGVNRLPLFRTDDQFREVVKAMAYNPKGTFYGLDLAMKGIVGEGNYEIYEDLLQYNNTVLIRLQNAAITDDISAGKSFMQSLEYDDLEPALGKDTLEVSTEPITVQSVVLSDLDELFDFRTMIPSAVTYPYYPGATPASAFAYTGTATEGSVVYPVTGGGYTIFDLSGVSAQSALYEMDGPKGARVVPESKLMASALIQFPTGHGLTVSDLDQCHVHIHDGSKQIGVGVRSSLSPVPIIGLYKPGDTAHQGSTVTLANDTWYEVTVWKRGEDWVELFVDGQLISRVAYSVFDSTGSHKVVFGSDPAGTGPIFHIKQLGMDIHTPRDYWSVEHASGITATGTPERFDSGKADYFTTDDEGKRLDIFGSGVANAYGGNNNGSWLIDSLPGGSPSQDVDLVGADHEDAEVESANPTRITVKTDDMFTFPDDLGKKITISGSSLGNDGTYVITKLLKEGTLEDLAGFDTEIPQKTNVCECSTATFVSETGLDWHLIPNMVTESGLEWRLSDAGSFSGTTITLREALWVAGLIMGIRYTDVLSAQVLEDTSVANTLIQDDPEVLYEYYPFYINDPLGILQAYLVTVTAAGVIPDFEIV